MEIQRAVSLKKHTTFKIGGPADYFCAVKSKDELADALKFAKGKKLPFFILGSGSNLLVSDNGYVGVVIKMQNAKCKIQNSIIAAEAGVNLQKLQAAAADAELSGLEWAAGIPGTFGGAVRGNAGAFGNNMAQSIERVETYDSKAGKIVALKNNDCKFGYRTSIFKFHPYLIILAASLILQESDKEKIRKKMNEYLNYRRERHPQGFSAGSIFKNFSIKNNQTLLKKFPEFEQFQERGDVPAAFLIAQCGLNGKKIGEAQISQKHPNFIINLGNAKANDVVKLMELVKKSVKEKFKIKLEEEIQLLGF